MIEKVKDQITLENGSVYLIIYKTFVNSKECWYLMNREDNADIRFVELVGSDEIRAITDTNELTAIIDKMRTEMDIYFD